MRPPPLSLAEPPRLPCPVNMKMSEWGHPVKQERRAGRNLEGRGLGDGGSVGNAGRRPGPRACPQSDSRTAPAAPSSGMGMPTPWTAVQAMVLPTHAQHPLFLDY